MVSLTVMATVAMTAHRKGPEPAPRSEPGLGECLGSASVQGRAVRTVRRWGAAMATPSAALLVCW